MSLFLDQVFTGLVESDENYVGNSEIKKRNQTRPRYTNKALTSKCK